MDTEVTKQLSTIITLKRASEEQIRVANENFKKNVYQNFHKIDVFQDLQSFLDIAMENQDVYDRSKIDAIKSQMNLVLDKAAQEMDMFVITQDKKRETRIAQNVIIPENRKKEFISVMKKLANRGKQQQDRSTKLFQKWRLKRLAKKMLLASQGGINRTIPELPEESYEMDGVRMAYESAKRDLENSKIRVEELSQLEAEMDMIKSGIQKVAKTLEIPLITNIKQESNDFFLKTLNMINFEIDYLKRPAGDDELRRALREIDVLKSELTSANQIIQEISEESYNAEFDGPQKELVKSKLLVSQIDTTIVDMEKSQLMNKIEELEEEHQHSVVETGRYMQEIEDLQERVKKYENQLVYYKNNNDLQNKEIEHLKNTKRLYEECMEDLNKAEMEISNMKRDMIELNEIRRRYHKAERKLKKIKMSEDWQGSPARSAHSEELFDIGHEFDKAINRISSLEKELREEREKTLTIKEENELELLYENSQREIEHLNQELQKTWRKLNQMDSSELLDKLDKAEQVKERLHKKIDNQNETLQIFEGKVRLLEAENRKFQEMAQKPSINSNDMIEIINKIEDAKQGQRFSQTSSECPTSNEYMGEIRNLKSRLMRAEKEKNSLRMDLKAQTFKDNEVGKYKEKIESLEKQLEKFKKSKEGSIEKKKHESLLRKTESKNERLQKKIKELEKEINKLRESEKDLSNELERIIKERELFIQAARTKRDSSKTNISAVKEGRQKKLIAIHSDKNEVDQNAKPIGRIQLEELDLDLEQENQALRDELDFMTRLKDKFSKKLNEKRKEVIYVKEERDQAIKIKEEIEDELEKAYEDIDRLEEEKTEHIRIIEELRSRLRNIKDYEIEINNLQIKIKVFSDENNELYQRNESCFRQIEILKIKIEELTRMNSDIIDGNNTELTHVIDELRILKVKFAEVEVSLSEEIRLHKETKIEFQHSIKRCEDLSEKLFHSMNEIELLKQRVDSSNNQINHTQITIESKIIEEYKVKISSYVKIQNQLRSDLKGKIEEIMKRDELLSKRDEDMARHLSKIDQLGKDLEEARAKIKKLQKIIKDLKREKANLSTHTSRRRLNKNHSHQQSQSFSIEKVEWRKFNTVKIVNCPMKTIVRENPQQRPTIIKSIDRTQKFTPMLAQNLPIYKINLEKPCCMCGSRKVCQMPRTQTVTHMEFAPRHNHVRTMEPSVDLNMTNNSNGNILRASQVNPAMNRTFHNASGQDPSMLKIRDLKNIPIDNNFIKTIGNPEEKDIRRSSSVPFNPMAKNSAIFDSMHADNVMVTNGYKTQKGFYRRKKNTESVRVSKNGTTANSSNRMTNDILRASSNSMARFQRRVPSIHEDMQPQGGNIKMIKGFQENGTPVNRMNPLARKISRGSLGSHSIPRKSHSASKYLTIQSNRTPAHLPARANRTTKNPERDSQMQIEINSRKKGTFSSFFTRTPNGQNSKMVLDKKITIKSKLGEKIVEPDMVKVIESEGDEHLAIEFEKQPQRQIKLKVRKDKAQRIKRKARSPKGRLKAHRRSINPDSFIGNKTQIKNKVEEKYQRFKKSSTTRNNLSAVKEKDSGSKSKKLFSFNGKSRMPQSSKKPKKKGITGKYSFGDGKGMSSFDGLADRSNGNKRSMAKKISMLTGNGGISKMKPSGKFSYFN